MSRYIDADELKERFLISTESCTDCTHNHQDCRWRDEYSLMDFCSAIDDLPTVDVTEVKHGGWELDNDGYYRCTYCNARARWTYDRARQDINVNYCCNCGAKMDGAK